MTTIALILLVFIVGYNAALSTDPKKTKIILILGAIAFIAIFYYASNENANRKRYSDSDDYTYEESYDEDEEDYYVVNFEWIKTPESSVFNRIGYEKNLWILALEFNDGDIYYYYDVPFGTWDELCDAKSKGNYFNKHIRDNYEYELVY